jgi:hypothetical protein
MWGARYSALKVDGVLQDNPLSGGWRRNFKNGLEELDCCTPNIVPRVHSASRPQSDRGPWLID